MMLTGGLLVLAGCGGGARVVTKTVTLTRPATVSHRPNPRATGPSAAARALGAALIAADVEQSAVPVGQTVFGPAEAAAVAAMASAAPSPTASPPPPHSRVVAGQATGQYAVAYTNGTFHHPSQITLNIAASPSQLGSVYWNVVCFEDNGGVGRTADHKTLQLPTNRTLPLPAPSNECIASANVQLSKKGSVTISLTG